MKCANRCWFILLMFAFALPCNAADSASAQAPSSAPAAVAQPPSTQDPRLDVIKAEVQLLKDFTQNILSTVYFALSTTVLILLTLIGYNWFQNYRVYERDREVMRESLSASIAQSLETARADLKALMSQQLDAHERDNKASFAHFDKRMAEVFGLAMRQIMETTLNTAASIHRTTHAAPTPETDLLQLLIATRAMIGRVGIDSLKHALSEIVRTMEETPKMGVHNMTSLLELAGALPEECSAYATQLRKFAG